MKETIILTITLELYEYLYRHVDIQMRHYRLMARERPRKAEIYEPKYQFFAQGINDLQASYERYIKTIRGIRKDRQQGQPLPYCEKMEREQPIKAGGVLRPLPPYMELVQCVVQENEKASCQLHQASPPGHEACTSECNDIQTIKSMNRYLLAQLAQEKAKNKRLTERLDFFEHLATEVERTLQMRLEIAKRA